MTDTETTALKEKFPTYSSQEERAHHATQDTWESTRVHGEEGDRKCGHKPLLWLPGNSKVEQGNNLGLNTFSGL